MKFNEGDTQVFDSFNQKKIKEDYLINLDIIIEDSEVLNVPAKIFLPKKKYDQPYIHIKIPVKNVEIFYSGKGSIKYKSTALEIESSEVWFNILPFEQRNNFDIEVPILCEPQNLKIKKINDLFSHEKPEFEVLISDNSFINFFTHDRFDIFENGEICNVNKMDLDFEISNTHKIKISNHYAYENNDNTTMTRSKYLCVHANINQDNIEADIDSILLEINSF